jgi:hypothetical protein
VADRKNTPTKKAGARSAPGAGKAEGEAAVQTKVAAMPPSFRILGERLHALVLRSVPALQPTLWYGMPAYAKDGNVICFFRSDKYMTFGLTDKANHDLGESAPHQPRESSWFFDALDDATEARLSAIVRKAAS